MNATRPNSADSTGTQSLQATINNLDDGLGVSIGQLLTHLAEMNEDGADMNEILERVERLENTGEIYNATGDGEPRYRVTVPEELEFNEGETVVQSKTPVAPGTIETTERVVAMLTEARGEALSIDDLRPRLPFDRETIQEALAAAEDVNELEDDTTLEPRYYSHHVHMRGEQA